MTRATGVLLMVCLGLTAVAEDAFAGGRAQAPAGGQGAQARPAPASPIPAPSAAAAERMIGATRAKAAELGINLACVVLDMHGDIVAALRMDGATFLNMAVAQAKARASAFFGQPSGALAERAAVLQNIGGAAGQPMLTVQGALPVVQDGRRVGAIGCSGAAAQQDEDAARAGLAAAAP